VGPGRVGDLYQRYADPTALRAKRGHVHNTPLQILVERGPLGLLVWLWFFATFFVEARHGFSRLAPDEERQRGLLTGGVVATIGFRAAGLSEYNLGDSEVVMTEYGVMGVALAATPRPSSASKALQPPAETPAIRS